MESDQIDISLGKTELKFDREQEDSSRDFPVFERTALRNMVYGGELAGAWICGKNIAGGWLYYFGFYSNDRQDEWSNFSGGVITLAKIGYNYTSMTSFDQAEAKVQWLHNTEPGYVDENACAPSPLYSNCISISNEITAGRLGHINEILWADGVKGRPDVYGIADTILWSFTKKFQFVNVLEYSHSELENGVILPARYETLSSAIDDHQGDLYFADYAGLNYYVDGHNLKLMSGVKYSHMSGGSGGGNFDGWTWLAGVRMAF